MSRTTRWTPAHWSLATLAVCQAVAIAVSLRQQVFFEVEGIVLPEFAPGLPIVYFFIAEVAMGIALAFLPVKILNYLIKGIFFLLYAWGAFVVLWLSMPFVFAGLIAVCGTVAWLIWPRLWLHNLLLGMTMIGYASVFGFMLSPVVALVFMAVISVYDLVSVKSGHMMWMVKKLPGVAIVPAFVFPRSGADWSMSLSDISLNESDERNISLLGGGGIGFSLILLVSVPEGNNGGAALIMAGFLSVDLRKRARPQPAPARNQLPQAAVAA